MNVCVCNVNVCLPALYTIYIKRVSSDRPGRHRVTSPSLPGLAGRSVSPVWPVIVCRLKTRAHVGHFQFHDHVYRVSNVFARRPTSRRARANLFVWLRFTASTVNGIR